MKIVNFCSFRNLCILNRLVNVICLQRNVYTVEDEFHFFLLCPAYDAIREIYFKPEWKNTITTIQKVHNIMSSNVKSDIFFCC